ncbi:MAG: MTAP family purine nucleoside phosphorylase [Methanomicrobiales archaeon]|nr:MTAP family purine nucleoside phosphorylase [Methanomicrobiales archaeon]MDI6877486.1 MTAP family purine nucleoside phosphorylase [Methanomicrobiales archaeon]
MLGIIGGTSLLYAELPSLAREVVHTPFGSAEVLCGERIAILLRHQRGLPPHRINYRANIAALAVCGVDRLVSIGSAGALKTEIPVGSLLIPADYISLADIPSIHDHAIEHVCPELDPLLSRSLKETLPEARLGGTYVQTRGPRIETKAEVQVLARIADVVGMTVASEATVARELGIPCAALCTIDNLAHGLGCDVLTYEHILEVSRAQRGRTEAVLRRIVEMLA